MALAAILLKTIRKLDKTGQKRYKIGQKSLVFEWLKQDGCQSFFNF
jgi:hypothetical protein